MGAMKLRDGPMPDLRLPDLHRSKDSSNTLLVVRLAQGFSSSTMPRLRNNTISTRTTMATVTMMVMEEMDTTRDMVNSMMTRITAEGLRRTRTILLHSRTTTARHQVAEERREGEVVEVVLQWGGRPLLADSILLEAVPRGRAGAVTHPDAVAEDHLSNGTETQTQLVS